MKHYITLTLGIFITYFVIAQPNTEVYLFDLKVMGDSINLSNKINISNNEGYDNQPSFYDFNTVLFSSTRNGQTDIRQYDIASGNTTWVTNTPVGSEYSPTRIPNSNDISAIRLDTTRLQRLYRYHSKGKTSKPILKDAKVGYHLWYAPDILLNTVLVENRMDLVVSNLSTGNNDTLQQKVGRNLLKIPNSEYISFVSKEGNQNLLKSMNITNGEMDSIVTAFTIEDFAWLSNGTILAGYQNKLLKFTREKDNKWSAAHDFSDSSNIGTISRIVVNHDQTKLALVATEAPEAIINKQVEAYNGRNLDGFVNCYAENVWVGRFPKDTFYMGRETMRKNYGDYFDNVTSTKVEVLNRIVLGTTVIDQELATDGGEQKKQVAIYQVQGGRIQTMTFLFDNESVESPVEIVLTQLEAYNNRDIDAFLATYTDDIVLYNFPNDKTSEGQEAMRKGYQDFFESTPDLHCEIKNRIVIGNKVIDEENVTVNGQRFSAVAIYEIEKGKIAKVTFIQ